MRPHRARRSLLFLLLAAVLVAGIGPASAGKRKPAPKPKAPEIAPALEAQLWDILERGTRTGDIPTRGRAIGAIALLRPEQSRTYAIESLKDPQWDVRAGAMRALIRKGDAAWVAPLQEMLARGRSPERLQALRVLDRAPEGVALDALFHVFEAPNVPNRDALVDDLVTHGGALANAAFTRAFVGKGSPPAVFRVAVLRLGAGNTDLLSIAAKSSDPDVQKNVVAVAGKLPETADVAFLEPLLAAKDSAVRTDAAVELARRGNRAATPVLLPLVESEDFDTRVRAIHALAGVATSEAVTKAVEYFENSEPPTRAQLEPLVDALFELSGAANDTQLLPLLQSYLTGTDPVLRILAVKHLAGLQGSRALPTLHELLFDGHPEVRKHAARALGRLGQSESIPHLQRALDDRDPDVRRLIAAALAGFHDRAVVDVVAFLVSDFDDEVRVSAARALANARHPEALPALRIAIGDRKPEVRLAAFRGMLAIDSATALKEWTRVLGWIESAALQDLARENAASFQTFIEEALKSGRPEMRIAALDATLALGRTDRLTLLGTVVKEHSHLDVRLGALTRLVAEQGGSARLLLHDLSNDVEKAMRIAAIETLAEVGDASSVEVLQTYLADGDEEIRVTAAATITSILTR